MVNEVGKLFLCLYSIISEYWCEPKLSHQLEEFEKCLEEMTYCSRPEGTAGQATTRVQFSLVCGSIHTWCPAAGKIGVFWSLAPCNVPLSFFQARGCRNFNHSVIAQSIKSIFSVIKTKEWIHIDKLTALKLKTWRGYTFAPRKYDITRCPSGDCWKLIEIYYY